jgi:hypothetical protein
LAALAATDNPYSLIGERNLFRLTDPPDPTPPPVEVPEEPPPNVKFTGYTTLMNKTRGLFKVQVPAAPPTPAKVESYILAVGGPGEGGIEVLAIDKENEKAQVRIKGKESWLPLEKDTLIAAAAAPAPVVPPGASPAQAAAIAAVQQKLAAAQAARGGAPPTAVPGIPQRNVRTPGIATAGVTGSGGLGLAANRANRGRVSPSHGLSPEEQVILIEANRMTAPDGMPPLPPTPMTPPELDPTTPPDPTLDELMRGLPQ